ncbi:SDR family oxidoreductase [Pseudonocardia sp. C8]|uniref:SDR family NAD(P)-dependent oxidoreductase n=1 Tax=Pseudonocardia sp. C8 TaxID=2762759 RepID=UPI0016431969|nr:SDR family oxidoreductase [Pseudonocardia sp. C8]MBC3191742.1 SDR family oxidoreductase [Pseudonocardia sp. C8]
MTDRGVALVTGAAGGIGRSVCRRLREDGFRIALTDVDERALVACRDELGTGAEDLGVFAADLAEEQQIADLPGRVAAELGGIDVLVNNAGVRTIAPLLEIDPADWRRTLDIDLTAPFLLIRAVLPGMLERGRGKIVNISSMAGLAAFADRAAYASAKAGLGMLTRCVAVEYGRRGIWCNAVAPGVVETPMTSSYFDGDGPMARMIRESTPVGRWAVPSDIAGPVAFLAGPESDYLNGAVVPVEGGWTAGYPAARLSP